MNSKNSAALAEGASPEMQEPGPFTEMGLEIIKAMVESEDGNINRLMKKLIRLNPKADFAHSTLTRYHQGKSFPSLPDMDKIYTAAKAPLPDNQQQELDEHLKAIREILNRHRVSTG